ncbi:hypothetical protein CBM2634_A160120 [Cupriavidus taiwanensis]|uniref:Uncharacterized protein n=1 Tax=Cupriavidus taiwanensis TaxID=164546 RepID=A0A375IVT8_9BURK|nr:hypothetical protein CBM2634_A160120 [Cupriavidus taiwanensis]
MKKGRGPPACEPRVARQAAALGLLLYCLLLDGWVIATQLAPVLQAPAGASTTSPAPTLTA